MPNISPTAALRLEEELQNLALYKFHPNGILNHSLNRLQDMLDGKVELVDPNNPFMYLLETSCINTAFAVQEYTLLARKMYMRLANTEDDLYLHMSDFDYLGRFSEPASAMVKFSILFNDFTDNAYYDPVQKEHVLKLPRHLKVSVDKYIFTMTSAVIIRLTDTGVIDVKYENQDFNNVIPVETNYINFNLVKLNQLETYLNFDLKLPEIDIEAVEIPVEKSKLFKNTVNYNPDRRYFFFRAFRYFEGNWLEMVVTHTDQVYDINTPTCILKVLETQNRIEYYIPPVYASTGMIGTKVKFMIYTTRGEVNVNFNDYKISDFNTEYNQVFPEEELDEYTQPLQLITKVVYIEDEIIDGKNGMSFADLKKSVIDNSIGDRKLPITNKQKEFSVAQNNFRLIKDVDVVTNRIFLLETSVPNAKTRYPIARFNLDIIEYATTIRDLTTNKNNIVKLGDNVVIIPKDTVFKLTEQGLELLDNVKYTQLKSLSGPGLAGEVNKNQYLAVFYHYILDLNDNQLQLRAYDIAEPVVQQINFKEFNSTARLGINTTNTSIYRTPTGFGLDILANFTKYLDFLNETNLKAVIVYRDNDESVCYLEGRLYTVIDTNPVFRFEFNSDYYITADGLIRINNFKDNNGVTTSVNIGLSSKLELLYLSNHIPTTYERTSLDTYIYNSYMSAGNCAITLEEISVKFGDYLKLLYTKTHTSVGTFQYKRYEENVPMRYKQTVYDSDNKVLHQVNDIVYNEYNDVVYEHLAGEVILNPDGKPTPINELDFIRYMNLMFIDYKAILGTKSVIKDYREQLRRYLTERVTVNAVEIDTQLLENTQAFVVVPKNIGYVKVKSNNRVSYISSMQQFKVDVYVGSKIFNDEDIRNSIVYSVVATIDNYLYERTVLNKTELLNALYERLTEFVLSVSLEGFTELNEGYIELLDTNCRIGLRKNLIPDPDGYEVSDDVIVKFILV